MGNIAGSLYFFYFQAVGLLLGCCFFRKKDWVTKLLTGSVLGSVLLCWAPALLAFFLDFSVNAHLAAAVFCGICAGCMGIRQKRTGDFPLIDLPAKEQRRAFWKRHRVFLILFALTFLLFLYLLFTHTLLPKEDGLHTGQCSYGDMNMHLGFITSIARQQTFPPFYSISPGDKLCYPFLCDSNSSSLYLFGASLRFAYMLPMAAAFLQVSAGFYCIAYSWLKKAQKACLAWYLFFYNGGLGFLYFIDWSAGEHYQLSDIFTGYYTTPTNLVGNNIRWVNLIVDMLLPQRSTLFGYAVLFTAVWLLWRAVYGQEKELFPAAAVLGGALPMINTHSFLAFGLIGASWLLAELGRRLIKTPVRYPGKKLFIGFLVFMCVLQYINGRENAIPPDRFLKIALAGIGVLVLLGIFLLVQYIKEFGARELLSGWGLYLGILLVLALPQLFIWTFSQAAGEGFTQGHFNWANQGDAYLWFYIKNWGVMLLLMVPALLYCSRRNFSVLFAAFVIWYVVELIAFSPNTYDNNKLLYVAFLFLCCISADYGYEIYRRWRKLPGIKGLALCFLLLGGVSAILSMGREAVSDYLVYSNDQINAAAFVEAETPADATFLTNDRHVNEVAALTGRNIVSGAGVYLGPHGIYDEERAEDVKQMYESPQESAELYKKYNVDYILISSWERGNYEIQEEVFDALYPVCYSGGEVKIYRYQS